jgi:hypothetical protein
LLTLAIGFWPTPRAAYPALFHAHANALFALAEAPHVRLAAPEATSGPATDTVMSGAPQAGAGPAWRSWFDLRRIGWWPSAALLAMLLATPLNPGRRVFAILAGLGLIDLFTLGRIGVEIAYAGSEASRGAAPGGLLDLLLRVGSESLTATVPSVAIVFLAWVLVATPRNAIDLRGARSWLGSESRAAARESRRER